jgi:hypothetical protein
MTVPRPVTAAAALGSNGMPRVKTILSWVETIIAWVTGIITRVIKSIT